MVASFVQSFHGEAPEASSPGSGSCPLPSQPLAQPHQASIKPQGLPQPPTAHSTGASWAGTWKPALPASSLWPPQDRSSAFASEMPRPCQSRAFPCRPFTPPCRHPSSQTPIPAQGTPYCTHRQFYIPAAGIPGAQDTQGPGG